MKMEFFAYIFVFVFMGVAFCPKGIAQTNTSQFSELKLEISTSKEKYLQLEPIPITFEISNPTDTFILGHTGFNLTSNATKLLVRNESGEEEVFNGFSPVPKQVGIYPRPIKPDESHKFENILNYQLEKMFPTPGKYQVQAILSNVLKGEKPVSNTINIEILAPEGINKQAYEFITKTPNAIMFYTGGMIPFERQAEIWTKFLLYYGESDYGDYINFALGEYFYHSKKYQEAKDQFQKISDKNNFVLSEKAKTYLLGNYSGWIFII